MHSRADFSEQSGILLYTDCLLNFFSFQERTRPIVFAYNQQFSGGEVTYVPSPECPRSHQLCQSLYIRFAVLKRIRAR